MPSVEYFICQKNPNKSLSVYKKDLRDQTDFLPLLGICQYQTLCQKNLILISFAIFLLTFSKCNCFAVKPDIVPFSFGREVVNQGDFAQLTCVVSRGDRPLSLTWSLKGDIINSDPTLTTTMIGQQTSLLMISSVDYTHIGEYTCRAENPAGISKYSAELKVNGNLTE